MEGRHRIAEWPSGPRLPHPLTSLWILLTTPRNESVLSPLCFAPKYTWAILIPDTARLHFRAPLFRGVGLLVILSGRLSLWICDAYLSFWVYSVSPLLGFHGGPGFSISILCFPTFSIFLFQTVSKPWESDRPVTVNNFNSRIGLALRKVMLGPYWWWNKNKAFNSVIQIELRNSVTNLNVTR